MMPDAASGRCADLIVRGNRVADFSRDEERGPKTNNAAEKPVDVAAASMPGTGGIYWHVFGTRVSVDPGLFTACLNLAVPPSL